MSNRITKLAFTAITVLAMSQAKADTIPSPLAGPVQWRASVAVSPAFVPGTNSFLRGENPDESRISSALSSGIRLDFSFNPASREGMLYPELYQGVGVDMNTFFHRDLLGTPVSLFLYQGAPIAHLGRRLWIGYEWEFGAAFGWKHETEEHPQYNTAVSTSVTAHIRAAFKFHYNVSDHMILSAGLAATHYSNGNTSWPNKGVNTLGASIALTYLFNPYAGDTPAPSAELKQEADKGRWFYDITAYGAVRKRVVTINDAPQMCPGRFGVAGIQFAPMRRLNRWVAVGPSLDIQFDESAGLEPYWVQWTTGDDIKFHRPPFGKQLSAGLSAHAELTMPIFSVNAGFGYDFVNPAGNQRFYQSLALKAFVTRHIYVNVGYRLGDFKRPQNLMLGAGVRI